MLHVKRLDPNAKLPTVAHPGEDLAYDLYALEDTWIGEKPLLVRTGIAAQAFFYKSSLYEEWGIRTPVGLLIRDRSSMASKGVLTSGGVIDPGYTGEIKVIMTSLGCLQIKAGDKIAQMIPIPVLTGNVEEVEELGQSSRGGKGFGSSGN